MKMNIAILAIGASVAMVSTAVAGEIAVTEESYDQIFVGNTLLGGTKHKPWKLFEKADGRRVFYMANGFVDKGKRWFNDKIIRGAEAAKNFLTRFDWARYKEMRKRLLEATCAIEDLT